jgi:DNA polymerase III alpha subunit (gram-positive type)
VTVAVLDTETTGLILPRVLAIDYQPYVVEVYAAAVDPADGRVLQELDSLVRPPVTIPQATTDYTKISTAMVSAAPRFADVLPRLRELVEAVDAVYAHNAHFDVELIDVEVTRARAAPIRWPAVICTIEQTAHLTGYRLSLAELHRKLFAEDFVDAHRARADATALIRCVVEMTRRGLL